MPQGVEQFKVLSIAQVRNKYSLTPGAYGSYNRRPRRTTLTSRWGSYFCRKLLNCVEFVGEEG